jgi:hypothetical protein
VLDRRGALKLKVVNLLSEDRGTSCFLTKRARVNHEHRPIGHVYAFLRNSLDGFGDHRLPPDVHAKTLGFRVLDAVRDKSLE